MTTTDTDLIRQIAERAATELPWHSPADPLYIACELWHWHKNVSPLRLADLLAADRFNLAHDIGGIVVRDYDPTFEPRFTAPREKAGRALEVIDHQVDRPIERGSSK